MPSSASSRQRLSTVDEPATVDILGVQVNRIDTGQLLNQIETWVERARSVQLMVPQRGCMCRQICTVNPEFVIDARRDSAFAGVLQRADLRVADGVGIIWAARLQGVKLPERVTGSDGVYRICERAAEKGWRVYFLGAGPGIAERAAGILQQEYPQLLVAGTYAGSPQEEDWPRIEARLGAAEPDIVLVAFGHPRQDFWIDRHRSELPAAVAMGVGGAFDFVAGVTVRAPMWMRRLGLEWLHRLIHQPWRWRRMSKLPVFAALAVGQSLLARRRCRTTL
jgi:N-acetylglucosaminyldiphosphoundecaprenol N-acetyl-beta-D-mannosaminyltransferase